MNRLAPQTGTGFVLPAWETLTVVDPKGGQVSDFFCFSALCSASTAFFRVEARPGFLNSSPGSGGRPPGRNTLAVVGNCESRARARPIAVASDGSIG